MAIRFSDDKKPLPIRGLGNGELSVWIEGAALYSVGAGYSAPHLCSLSPDFGGSYHELETDAATVNNSLRHRLFYSDTVLGMPNRLVCDLQITDLLPKGMNGFVRRLEGITALCWRMSIPSYVRTVYHPSYRFKKHRADTLFLTIPAGTPFENGMATVKEQTAALVLCGSLRYDPLDHTIRYGGDLGELYLLTCSDSGELMDTADRLLDAYTHYNEEPHLHPIYGELIRQYDGASTGCSPLGAILTMQSNDGAIVASQREPYALASDLPALTHLLLQNDRGADALRMLLCWTRALTERGWVPHKLLCGTDAVCADGQQDYSATAAYLLSATRLLSAQVADEKEEVILFRGMRATFSTLMTGFKEGMLPFGTGAMAFDAGILGRELLFQGSTEVTALAIRAGEEFIAFCEQHGKRIAKEEKGYRRILAEASASFEKNFTYKGRIVRNAPRLETLARRPRFIRGVCTLCQRDGAYPFEDALELDKYGRYLCRKCFATRRGTPEETDPAKRYASPRATVMAALLTGSPVAVSALSSIAMTYSARLHEPKAALPLREADTDPLLLLTLRNRREELCTYLRENEKVLSKLRAQITVMGVELAAEDWVEAIVDYLADSVKEILLHETEEGTLPALLCDTAPLGARHSAGATALYLLATQ